MIPITTLRRIRTMRRSRKRPSRKEAIFDELSRQTQDLCLYGEPFQRYLDVRVKRRNKNLNSRFFYPHNESGYKKSWIRPICRVSEKKQYEKILAEGKRRVVKYAYCEVSSECVNYVCQVIRIEQGKNQPEITEEMIPEWYLLLWLEKKIDIETLLEILQLER